jgi:predicted HTH domain antitoxin
VADPEVTMSAVDLHIPEDVIRSLRLPSEEVEDELRRDLAVVLYARGALSVGKAAEFAGVSRREFETMLGERKIRRQYDEESLAEDLDYAEGDR